MRDYINMMVKDRDVAEDIFQETFIKAVRVIDARPLYGQREVSLVGFAHRAQSGDRLFPRPAAEQGRHRSRSRIRCIGIAAFRRAERGGRHGQRTDRARRARIGRAAPCRAARGGDDALFRRSQFQGYRRADRREYKHRVGPDALCAYQPAADDQGKKYDFVLTGTQYFQRRGV